MQDFNEFTDNFLAIDQSIRGPIAYAVESFWYKYLSTTLYRFQSFQNFLERMFQFEIDSLSDMLPIQNNEIAIYYVRDEINEQQKKIQSFFQQHFGQAVQVEVCDTGEQMIRQSSEILKNFVLVNQEYWQFLKSSFNGGPTIPLYGVQYDQVRYTNDIKWVSSVDLETIDPTISFTTTQISITIALVAKANTVVTLQISVPLQLLLHEVHYIVKKYMAKLCPQHLKVEGEKQIEVYVYDNNNTAKEIQISLNIKKNLYELNVQNEDIIVFYEQHLEIKSNSTAESTKESFENNVVEMNQCSKIILNFIDKKEIEDLNSQINDILCQEKKTIQLPRKHQIKQNLEELEKYLATQK